MKKNGVVLGLIFVIIGFIILLKSFGLLSFSWWTIGKVWPFAFVFIGIAIMPIEKIWKGFFHIIAIVICVTAMVYLSEKNDYSTWRDRLQVFINKHDLKELKEDIMQADQISHFGFSDSIVHVKVDAEFTSGKYLFETKSSKKMLRFAFQGNSYSTSIAENGTTGFLNLYPKTWNSRESNGKIYLYEKFGYTFNLQGEKSDVSLNAVGLKIDTLNINANEASTWQITLSKLVPEAYIFIKAHPDAGSIELTIPTSSGYRFTTSAIQDTIQWNNLQPIETGTYQSDNFKEAKSQVFIQANTGEIDVRQK
jgi:hypothetical protein